MCFNFLIVTDCKKEKKKNKQTDFGAIYIELKGDNNWYNIKVVRINIV